MAGTIDFELPGGRNITFLQASCMALMELPANAGFAVIIRNLSWQFPAFGGNNPASWSDAKQKVFQNAEVIELEDKLGQNLAIRIGIVDLIVEKSATEFELMAPGHTFPFEFGGDNPATWKELKTLVFGP